MKILKYLLISIILFSMAAPLVVASTLNVNIEGITSEEIEGFAIKFNVLAGFDLQNYTLGSAIPDPVGSYGWIEFFDSSGNELEASASNWDYAMYDPPRPNPLLNGGLFSFEYTGTIIGIENMLFTDYTGITTYDVSYEWMDAENLIFSAGTPIPIPGAVYFMGSGLCLLVVIRRKIN